MNFLLHRYLAARDLGSTTAGIGAMLPDLWRMADRRVRPARLVSAPPTLSADTHAILAGIEHHLEADRWFHASAAFVDGERLTADRLRASGLDAPKLGLFAHISWELCLDGALIRREGLDRTLALLREGFAAAREGAAAAASWHHFDRIERTGVEREAFDATMQRLFTELARGPWIAGYQHGAGIAQRIDGMRGRLGLERMGAADRAQLASVFDELVRPADAALSALT